MCVFYPYCYDYDFYYVYKQTDVSAESEDRWNDIIFNGPTDVVIYNH